MTDGISRNRYGIDPVPGDPGDCRSTGDARSFDRRTLLRLAGALPIVGAAASAFPTTGARAFATGGSAGDVAMSEAFYYAFPLYEFARTEQTLAKCVGNPGMIGKITHRNQLSDYRSRTVTAPNNDTIYSSCFMDLSAGPMEVVSPTIHTRYFSIAFMDAFTDNFAYIGTRATNGVGGRYWVVGPQWSGNAPRGVHVFRSATNDVWMLARMVVDGPEDLPAAVALLDKVAVVAPGGGIAPRGFENAAVSDPADPALFLAVVNEMLRRSPGGRGQLARASQLKAWGIGPDARPDAAILEKWRQFLPIGLKDLREAFLFRDLVANGWTYQPPGVGNFGTNDRLRAAVALGGIAALGEKEAMYFHANFEVGGERLSGRHAYRWRVPPGGVPADAFWSLTMYDAQPDGRYYLVQNALNRYSIGDRTSNLVREADGSLQVLIQHDQPSGRLAPNWLPAPVGPMRLALRAYMPRQVLIERKWRVPPLERADPA
ncbi:MAG: DUF1254 domain-containing protein [Sphingomonas sp.]|jgi:hypothetical protein|uniref:DUF1254 domain-containing protein n=1 Tax=Sphingomonas sp. TaxID=28214 RepID=UPI003568D8F1